MRSWHCAEQNLCGNIEILGSFGGTCKEPQDESKPITIHRLRHTYATQKLRDGVSLPSVRKLLGHKNIQTTMRYVETDLDTVKRELLEARRQKG